MTVDHLSGVGLPVGWAAEAEVVDRLADRLGRPLDDGIKDTVIALRLLGFGTRASCEGHIDHGCSGPWVDVAVSRIDPGETRERLRKLVGSYETATSVEVEPGLMLITTALRSHLDARRVASLRLWCHATREARKADEPSVDGLERTRGEMKRFTDFLKQRLRSA